MTPGAFADTFYGNANEVYAGTGIDPFALLSQWAVETAWGSVIVGCNLGNIRCSPTSFCRYASYDEFCAAAVATWHNGYYQAVLATTGQPIDTQLRAIGESPWDAGHYTGNAPYNFPGGSLIQAEAQFMSVGTLPDSWLADTTNRLGAFLASTGTGNTAVPIKVADLMAAIKAIQSPPPATVDLSPVLEAIAALKLEVDEIKARVDHSLQGA